MKWLVSRIVLIVISVLATTSTHADLVGLYTFEGNASDSSGHGNHGIVNGAVLTANGYEGMAFEFDGIDDNIMLPIDINPTNHTSLTMGAWVNAASVDSLGSIISHDDEFFDRSLYLDNRGTGAGFRYSAFGGFNAEVVSAGPDPAPVNEWVFLAARYDDATQLLTLDVGTDRFSVNNANPGLGFVTTLIGASPGFNTFFDGRIDNVFFFDEFLSDARIDAIRLNGVSALSVPEPGSLAIALIAIAGFTLRRRTRFGPSAT